MTDDSPTPIDESIHAHRPSLSRLTGVATGVAIATLFLVDPVLAASSTKAFCGSAMAETVRNIFSVFQLGGPLIGGVLAVGSTIAEPMLRNRDQRRELKEVRQQALVYGVIIAPLGTTIIQFILNNVVAEGTSWGF